MFKRIGVCLIMLGALVQTAQAREQIRIVGSSTVYPFTTVVAEEFGRKTSFKTPVVESTGTGGGIKLFCSGVGSEYPDFVNASRKIKNSEVALCKKNGVEGITEINLGYDGIVLANSVEAMRYKLTIGQIFKALARRIPVNGSLVENEYVYWSDVDVSLPKVKISVYGPPPTSGTRDAFVELVMEPECVDMPEFKAAYPDKKERKKQCHLLREDGAFIESGENDNLIIQKLRTNRDALGIFGYSFLEQNSEIVQGAVIGGATPEFESISRGDYPVSRPLFVYMKDMHIEKIPGLSEFIQELISDNAIGAEGYLTFKGLVPLGMELRNQMRSHVESKL